MEKEGIKVCCTSGQPQCDKYTSVGTEINTSKDLKLYQVGSGNKNGLIIVYDIFGFNIGQTRRFADSLAEHAFNVVMPDFFRGKPWTLANFPPKNSDEFMKWLNEAGAYSLVEKDLVIAREQLQKTGAVGKPAILGFCWGGKMATCACQTNLYSCGVSVHGAGISEELVNDIKVPMMFLPAGDDPCLDSVEKLLQSKPFGKDCVFHRFDKMTHGFAAARGDWNNEETRDSVLKVISMTQNFLSKHSNN